MNYTNKSEQWDFDNIEEGIIVDICAWVKYDTLKYQMIPSEKNKQKILVWRKWNAIKNRSGKYYAPKNTMNKEQLLRKG